MTNYAFVINQRTCIGCHACSVACKSENEVPLGVYRTWVKYVETGAFPHTRRHFQVTRCNHCANPPCVRICPVTAMYQRADGIVEFDHRVCIGCKACLQACPYDAIYMDPATDTAAKCHYCSHRTDLGLEPACVIVCPTQSIIAGDLDDPQSEVSRLVAREAVSVRKPEQGTAPKLFYIDADDVTLTPTAPSLKNTMMWADVRSDQAVAMMADGGRRTADGGPRMTEDGGRRMADGQGAGEADNRAAVGGRRSAIGGPQAKSGTPIRTPGPQAMGVGGGPLMIGGRVAEGMVQTAYNAQHRVPWHWPVPAYLVTKGIGSGAFMTLAGVMALNLGPTTRLFNAAVLLLSLLFIGLTTALLVFDLTKPARFLTILTRPQWSSWVARGAFVLLAFSAVAGLWFLLELGGALGWFGASTLNIGGSLLAWLGLPLAVLTAIYTAFLFAQAEGRDLWQSPLLPVHLLVQALMVGSGALLALGLVIPLPTGMPGLLGWTFGASLVVDLFVTLAGEFGIPHASEIAARAAHAIRAGHYRQWFWWGSIGLGHVVPLALLALGLVAPALAPVFAALAGLAAIAGLYAFEYAFVMAPQEIPNS